MTYVEYAICFPSASFRVPLAQRDEFLGEALRFLGLGPCRSNRLVLEERGHEVTEEGLSVGGVAAEMPIFRSASGHD